MLYFITLMPYYLVFNINNGFLNFFDKIIDIYYIFDILINFNIAYLDKDSKFVFD